VKRVDDTSTLIRRLVADAKPVKRLPSPALRACFWLLTAGAAGWPGILLFANLVFSSGSTTPRCCRMRRDQCGIAAVVAAFQLSLPQRSQADAVALSCVWIGQ
jgi:hypothetical protein